MIALNIETIIGSMPVKANSRKTSETRTKLSNFVKSDKTGDFVTQYSNASRLKQDLLFDVYGVNYTSDSKEKIAEATAKLDKLISIKTYKLNNDQIKEVWSKIEADLAGGETIDPIQYNQKGIAYPAFWISKK